MIAGAYWALADTGPAKVWRRTVRIRRGKAPMLGFISRMIWAVAWLTERTIATPQAIATASFASWRHRSVAIRPPHFFRLKASRAVADRPPVQIVQASLNKGNGKAAIGHGRATLGQARFAGGFARFALGFARRASGQARSEGSFARFVPSLSRFASSFGRWIPSQHPVQPIS